MTRALLITLVSQVTPITKTLKDCASHYISVIRMQKREGKARFGLTMSPELLQRIEKERGLIPRATYIEYCLKQYFESRNSIQKLYDDMLTMLPERAADEDLEELRDLVRNLRSRILESKKKVL